MGVCAPLVAASMQHPAQANDVREKDAPGHSQEGAQSKPAAKAAAASSSVSGVAVIVAPVVRVRQRPGGPSSRARREDQSAQGKSRRLGGTKAGASELFHRLQEGQRA